MRLKLTLLALFSCTTAALAVDRIVFLAGSRSHGPGEHEFNAGCLLLAKALNEESGLSVKAEVIKGWPADDSVLDSAKAIIIYADGTSVVKKGWEKMDALAKQGKGIMFMHYAVHPDPAEGTKYYRPWIGGAFETGWSVNPHWVADLNALPNHPVARGITGSVQALDEFYYHMRFRENRSEVLDLVTATPSRERVKRYINLWNEHGVAGLDQPQTLMWGVERPDGGRGVGFSGGHYHRNWGIDGFRKLALNAIVWVAGLEVPKEGVFSKPVSEGELNANLDDKSPKSTHLLVPQPGEFQSVPAAPVDTERESKFPAVSGAAQQPALAKPVAESILLASNAKDRLIPFEAPLKGAKKLYLVAQSENSISCAWANWIEPELIREDGTSIDLTTLSWSSATTGSGAVRIGKTNANTPLLVAGKAYEKGIGTHSESVIEYSLPEGIAGFRAKVAIDDGGAIRNGKPSGAQIQFLAYTAKPPTPEERIASVPTELPPSMFTVPEGFEVTLWAKSPLLLNPTNIDFDAQGRLWVAEGVNYRGKSGRRPEGDRIVVLEDTKGQGFADKSTVFIQDKDLASPLGVAVFDNKVVVSQPPDLLVFTDTDGDGKFDPAVDKKEVLLSGFNGRQHDHSLHSVTAGPDGLWYWNQGNTGAQFTDKSGKSFYMGSPYMLQEIAGKKSDDGHVWIGGFAARMNPDGSNVQIIGHNFRNSYEQAVTSMGDVFQSDNDDPPACRVTAMMEGGNAGFASADGKRSWGADKRPGQSTAIAEWRQDDPGTMPAGDVYGGGAPTGVAFYENGALGDAWGGLLLACESGKNVVYGYLPKQDGAGWKLERFDFLTSNKEREFAGSDFLGGAPQKSELKNFFRPSDVTVGPDGAIYVADWFDARVGGHGTNDIRSTGAIYRIAPKGFKSVIPKLDLSTTEGQVAALRSPAPNVRFSGFTRLKAQGAKAVPAVEQLLNDPNPFLSARAIWLLAQMGGPGVVKVTPLLQSPDEAKRLVAYRALQRVVNYPVALARQLVDDPSSAIRREVALHLRDLPAFQCLPLLVKLASQFDGKDRAYLEAIGIGSQGKEAEVFRAILETAPSDPAAWGEPLAWLAWRLHPEDAVDKIKARALAATVPLESRKLMVTALAFIPTREAANAMIEVALNKDAGQDAMALWWLMNRKTNTWASYELDAALKERGLYDPDNVTLTAVPMPDPVPSAQPLSSSKQIADLAPDPVRGKAAVGVCYACHRIAGNGMDFGPELTEFGKQQTTEAIVEAIAQPSASISHGYEGHEIQTKDGLTITGMALSTADPVVMKCMGGVTQTIPRSRIKSMQKMTRSLMYDPSNLGLTDQSVADIVAYLKSL
ncbi:MAG: PVC-type heme-binding CxxCH protein [Verrucomicrobiota bacterium]